MARILLDRPFNPTIDVQPDGIPWPFALVTAEPGNETTVLADTCSDVLGHLIEGYDDIPDTPYGIGQAFARREAMAFQVAEVVQRMLINDAIQDGTLHFEQTPDDIADALLAERFLPTVGVDVWNHPVPLVLVSTLYQPFGTTFPPGGNIVWVEPHDERGFLDNLAHLGVAQLVTHATAQQPTKEGPRAGAAAAGTGALRDGPGSNGAGRRITSVVDNVVPLALTGGTASVDLKGQFDALWQTISSATSFAGVLTFMSVVGASLVGLAVLTWIREKRRRATNGGNRHGVIGALIVGCVLAAPASVIPAVLGILDGIVNGFLHVWNTSASGRL